MERRSEGRWQKKGGRSQLFFHNYFDSYGVTGLIFYGVRCCEVINSNFISMRVVGCWNFTLFVDMLLIFHSYRYYFRKTSARSIGKSSLWKDNKKRNKTSKFSRGIKAFCKYTVPWNRPTFPLKTLGTSWDLSECLRHRKLSFPEVIRQQVTHENHQ